jgi:hypothetical protein
VEGIKPQAVNDDEDDDATERLQPAVGLDGESRRSEVDQAVPGRAGEFIGPEGGEDECERENPQLSVFFHAESPIKILPDEFEGNNTYQNIYKLLTSS